MSTVAKVLVTAGLVIAGLFLLGAAVEVVLESCRGFVSWLDLSGSTGIDLRFSASKRAGRAVVAALPWLAGVAVSMVALVVPGLLMRMAYKK